jgi:hypothetical protein
VRRITYALLWLAVTAAAVFVAAAAVGSVRDQVTDAPAAMAPMTTTTTTAPTVSSVTPVADTSTTTTTAGHLTTTTVAQTTTTAPAATTTKPPSPPPTTTTKPPSPPPTTTSTTSTTPPPASEIRSYELVGGSVTVEIGSSTVQLAGASPKAGFRMEVEANGPNKVQVEFTSDHHESHFSGEFRDGRFVPEIDESGDDGDDD